MCQIFDTNIFRSDICSTNVTLCMCFCTEPPLVWYIFWFVVNIYRDTHALTGPSTRVSWRSPLAGLVLFWSPAAGEHITNNLSTTNLDRFPASLACDNHQPDLTSDLGTQVLLPWSSHPALPVPDQDSLHPPCSAHRPPRRPAFPGGRHLPPPPLAHPALGQVLLGATCTCSRVLATVLLPVHLSHLLVAGRPSSLSWPGLSSGSPCAKMFSARKVSFFRFTPCFPPCFSPSPWPTCCRALPAWRSCSCSPARHTTSPSDSGGTTGRAWAPTRTAGPRCCQEAWGCYRVAELWGHISRGKIISDTLE